MAKEVNYNELQELIAKGGLVAADFWAEWCGPCKMFAPTFAKVAEELKDKAHLVKVNVEENPEAQAFGIRSIPTIIFWKNGEEVERLTGALSEDAFRERVNSFL